MNMTESSLIALYERELRIHNRNEDEIEFVKSLIHEGCEDSSLYIMNNDAWRTLQERSLLDVFEKISHDNNIQWHHDNQPAR